MIIRPCAEFTSDLPDDEIAYEAGTHVVQFGGKSVAEAIAHMLKGFGANVDSAPDAELRGWMLKFGWQGRRLLCLVTLFEGGYVLLTADTARFSRSWKKNRAIYGDALTRLARALEADPRFHDVRWYSPPDLLGGGPGKQRPVSIFVRPT
jgi:hypothetical protein